MPSTERLTSPGYKKGEERTGYPSEIGHEINLETVVLAVREFLIEEGIFDGEDGSELEMECRLENDGEFVKEIINLLAGCSVQEMQDVLMKAGCPEPGHFVQEIASLKAELRNDDNRGFIGPDGVKYRHPGQMVQPREDGR